MRKRTRSREVALQALYQLDAQGSEALARIDSFVTDHSRDDPGVKEFALRLVHGVWKERERIDTTIRTAAENWTLERMALVDRNILRLAIYEMLWEGEIPAKVSINEAIEMGKRYGTAQSGAFINGILDRIRRDRVES